MASAIFARACCLVGEKLKGGSIRFWPASPRSHRPIGLVRHGIIANLDVWLLHYCDLFLHRPRLWAIVLKVISILACRTLMQFSKQIRHCFHRHTCELVNGCFPRYPSFSKAETCSFKQSPSICQTQACLGFGVERITPIVLGKHLLLGNLPSKMLHEKDHLRPGRLP